MESSCLVLIETSADSILKRAFIFVVLTEQITKNDLWRTSAAKTWQAMGCCITWPSITLPGSSAFFFFSYWNVIHFYNIFFSRTHNAQLNLRFLWVSKSGAMTSEIGWRAVVPSRRQHWGCESLRSRQKEGTTLPLSSTRIWSRHSCSN